MMTTVVLKITDINPVDIVVFTLTLPMVIDTDFTRFERSRVWRTERGGGISLHEKEIDGKGYLAVHDINGDIVFKSRTSFRSGVWSADIDYDSFVDNIAPEAYFKDRPIQLIATRT